MGWDITYHPIAESEIRDIYFRALEDGALDDALEGLESATSPDGKAVRFIISHQGDPASEQGIAHVDAIRDAGKDY